MIRKQITTESDDNEEIDYFSNRLESEWNMASADLMEAATLACC